jgi:MFS family permease
MLLRRRAFGKPDLAETRYPMFQALKTVASLLLGAGILILGNGLVGIVLPVRMSLEHVPTEISGLVMSAYYGGLVCGCLWGQGVISRVGHIRAFAAFAAGVAATTLIFPLWFNPIAWAVLRIIVGFLMAGLFFTIESWLNLRSTKKTRGQVLSLYMITSYLASVLGQLLVNVWSVRGLELFCLGAMLLCVSLVPVVLTKVAGPEMDRTSRLSIARLYRLSPLGVVASLGAGLISGAFYGMGPVFAAGIGMSIFAISIFMGIALLGGLLMQWPIGLLSDKYDRRTVLLFVLIAIAAACLLAFALSSAPHASAWLLLLTGLYGGGAAAVYPLAVAHAFDYVERDHMVAASAGMLLSWSIGATAGPLLASLAMAEGGDWTLYLYLAGMSGTLAFFTRYRMGRRTALPAAEQAKFAPRGEGTVAGTLDPRAKPAKA